MPQISTSLAWILGLPLRVLGFFWPLLTEAIALIWFGEKSDFLTVGVTVLLIAVYGLLCFAPNRKVFSALGSWASVALLATSGATTVLFKLQNEQVPDLLWVHLGFGIFWLLAIWLVRRSNLSTST